MGANNRKEYKRGAFGVQAEDNGNDNKGDVFVICMRCKSLTLKKLQSKKPWIIYVTVVRYHLKSVASLKIYLARQDQFNIPDSEELNKMKEENANLQEQLIEQKKAISEVEAEMKSLQSNLTMEEIQAKESKLRKEVGDEKKHMNLVFQHNLKKDRLAIEGLYSEALNQRRRRKRIRDVWDAITENSPKNPKEFKEELGVEYDEDVGVNFQSFADLI
ncbi:homologous-pairing protein 2 homolog [Capsicum annuum]|uniref:homologous-pairing protein 2 homolog n=1 Tax=Capsicum annuum TaxID=4072 RepID=UPI001FB06AC7|nr:homologous-pairing protein 2 homolog [Capsicum annuum]